MKRKKITVVGAGFVGATSAQRIAEKDLGDVVLLDIPQTEGMPKGKALDIFQSASIEGFSSNIIGTTDPKDSYGSDIVLVTAGMPRKPGMSRSDLLEVNAKIVNAVGDYIREGSPSAIVIVVTNPLDTMVYLMKARTGFSPAKVIGMAGILDSSRFAAFIAMELKVSPADIDAMVMGGHGDSMVPLTRFTTVNGICVEQLISKERLTQIVQRTRDGGAEIVNLLKTGSAYYAPSSSSVAMIRSITRDEKRIWPCAAYLTGQYGLKDIYMGTPCLLGAGGVEKIIELELADAEKKSLHSSADAIRKDLEMLREKSLLS